MPLKSPTNWVYIRYETAIGTFRQLAQPAVMDSTRVSTIASSSIDIVLTD